MVSPSALRALIDKLPPDTSIVEIIDRQTDRPHCLDVGTDRKKSIFVLSVHDEPDYAEAKKPIGLVIIGLSQYHQTMRAIIDMKSRLARGGALLFPYFSTYAGAARAVKENFPDSITCHADGSAVIFKLNH